MTQPSKINVIKMLHLQKGEVNENDFEDLCDFYASHGAADHVFRLDQVTRCLEDCREYLSFIRPDLPVRHFIDRNGVKRRFEQLKPASSEGLSRMQFLNLLQAALRDRQPLKSKLWSFSMILVVVLALLPFFIYHSTLYLRSDDSMVITTPLLNMIQKQIPIIEKSRTSLSVLHNFQFTTGAFNIQNVLTDLTGYSKEFQDIFRQYKDSISNLYQKTSDAMESYMYTHTASLAFAFSSSQLLNTIADKGGIWIDDNFDRHFRQYAEYADEISKSISENGRQFSSLTAQAQLAERKGVLLLEASVQEVQLMRERGEVGNAFGLSNSLCWTIAGITAFSPAAVVNVAIIPACLNQGMNNVQRAGELEIGARELGKAVIDQANELRQYSLNAQELVFLTRQILGEFNIRKEKSKEVLLDMRVEHFPDPLFAKEARYVALLWEQFIDNMNNES